MGRTGGINHSGMALVGGKKKSQPNHGVWKLVGHSGTRDPKLKDNRLKVNLDFATNREYSENCIKYLGSVLFLNSNSASVRPSNLARGFGAGRLHRKQGG